ncbi:Nucleoside phosphorylase [Penicillium expansum]|uniref:Nucleoside phosphorylase n=1 Tax=Penicillium expansum TaxID=27334 RepID=A0A0A2JVD6_PENEN|nr:Nucleoside phosphorylase [Penicillium expansum]KGO43187.1 Nucleoside phosphorylase [Penicillium expansum]KGO52367.1 Nucleoside phosphorylase [Penicillium expansum]KGO59427.1 Nucleoside phosphorylase [Penicillium expansum]
MLEIAERLDDHKQLPEIFHGLGSEPENQCHSKKLTHNDYAVGWICALFEEQTAATAMLDQEHPDLPTPPDDPNTYTLGSIGEHNVVIACLPEGRMGNNVAATFATQMARTFPSIRIRLIVGIGGGIPSKVKLGDVVISIPVDQYPGVVQWDLGKAEGGGKFRRTGALNSPPSVLLTAAAKVRTRNRLKKHTFLPQYLEEMGKNWPDLVPQYIEPPSSGLANSQEEVKMPRSVIYVIWDIILALFGYLLGWQILAPVDGGRELVRLAQTPKQQGAVEVHCGLIASGNQVIKDAKVRDGINEHLGGKVLCVEMEAAGLMNDFPCIVIRGICNYADKWKNDEWQPYAAAVAAACAKAVLKYVQPSHVAGEHPLRDILSQG